MTEQRQPDQTSVGRPRIHAIVNVDGTGAITIDGSTQIITERDTATARQAITAVAVDVARQAGHEVRMTSTDPDGQWHLAVSPDGQVETVPPPRPRSRAMEPESSESEAGPEPGREASPTGSEPVARHAARHDDADDTDDTDDGAADSWAAVEWEDPRAGTPAQKTKPESEPSAHEAEPTPTRVWSPPAAAVGPAPHPSATMPAATHPTAAAAEPPPAIAQPVPSWPPQGPYAAPSSRSSSAPLPTLNDLLDSRPAPPPGPAEWGWQGTLRRLSFGLIKPQPGPAELRHRGDVASVQRSLAGPRTIVIVNPKGGAHKTTATMLIAATFGLHRGGYTLAWDNNETRGTLGWRAMPSRHSNTAVNLLADLERFDDPARARIGDLDNYVRGQGSAQFDVLASDEDAGASANIEANAFRRLHAALSRFYRIMVIDTGNNMRASNWGAAVEAADQLVIVSTVREDTAASAAWLVDGLRSRQYEDKVNRAVTLLSSPGLQPDPGLQTRLHEHFGQLTRAVIDVPYDPALVEGAAIDISRLQPATREAWLHATAVIAEGL